MGGVGQSLSHLSSCTGEKGRASASVGPEPPCLHGPYVEPGGRYARPGGVWWNYWDTCLTYEGSYYARFNYIHWNPLKHGVTARPEEYPFSSYRAFLAEQEADIHRLERAYPFDRVRVRDDF